MTDTLKVGHAAGCNKWSRYAGCEGPMHFFPNEPCSGPPVCQYAEAQKLAAEVVRLNGEMGNLLRGIKARQPSEQLATLQRLAGEYLEAVAAWLQALRLEIHGLELAKVELKVGQAGDALAAVLLKEKP